MIALLFHRLLGKCRRRSVAPEPRSGPFAALPPTGGSAFVVCVAGLHFSGTSTGWISPASDSTMSKAMMPPAAVAAATIHPRVMSDTVRSCQQAAQARWVNKATTAIKQYGAKKQLVGWDVEPCRSEGEVGVKLQDGVPDQEGSTVNDQEEGEVCIRCSLQPWYETFALMPSTHYKPQPAGHLEGHAREKNALDRQMPVSRSREPVLACTLPRLRHHQGSQGYALRQGVTLMRPAPHYWSAGSIPR